MESKQWNLEKTMTRTYPITCRSCQGIGSIPVVLPLNPKPCPACHGTGVVTVTETLPDPPPQLWPAQPPYPLPGWPVPPHIGTPLPTVTWCDNPKPEPFTDDFRNPMVSHGGTQ